MSDNFECKKCGRNLYDAMVKSWPEMRSIILNEKLSEFPNNPTVTVPREKLKLFNAHYHELAEFASWVCGVEAKDFCRFDMMKYIQKKDSEKSK